MQSSFYEDEHGARVAWYGYDDGGERAVKFSGECVALTQNGHTTTMASLTNPVVYPSPLVTLTRRGYTKHYFEGERRICSAIGGGFTHVEWDSIDASQDKVVAPICDELFPLLDDGVEEAMHCVELNDIHLSGRLIYRMLWLEATKPHDDPEPVYYYHNDHLGGTAYLTDQTGQVAQTLAYLPYGEDWVDVTAFMYDTSQIGFYQFNGKEKDPETDYLYYGARYHWPDAWNGWLSPDPLMDDYPSISPYAYCAWNPVNLVDPDGLYIDSSSVSEKIWNMVNPHHECYNSEFADVFSQLLSDRSTIFSFEEWKYPEIRNENVVYGRFEMKEANMNQIDKTVIGYFWGPEGVEIAPERYLLEETYHAKQFLDGEFGFGRDCSVGMWHTFGFDMIDEENAHKWADRVSGSPNSWTNDAINYYKSKGLRNIRINVDDYYMNYDRIQRSSPPKYNSNGVYKDGYRSMRKPK